MDSIQQEQISDDTEVIEQITRLATPTNEEVSDWYFVDQSFTFDWERPLIRLLRFLATPTVYLAGNHEVVINASDDHIDPDSVVIDLVAKQDVELSSSTPTSEELAG